MRVAGFGFRKGAGLDSLEAALRAVGGEGITHLATVTEKAGDGVFRALADRLALPVVTVDAERLPGARTVTQSEASRAAYGTGSVAEACALIAAGPGAALAGPRRVSPDGQATCAIAVRNGEARP